MFFLTTSKVHNHVSPSPNLAALCAAVPLSLFQKILLCTDGTVTELLELYCGAPIAAHKLGQSFVATDTAPVALAAAPEVRVLQRTVLLGPAHTAPCLYAQSHFIFDRFSPAIQSDLLHTELPIGLLWRREQLEMHREIIAYACEPDAQIAALLQVALSTPLLSRSYRILSGAQVLGVITEKFASTALR